MIYRCQLVFLVEIPFFFSYHFIDIKILPRQIHQNINLVKHEVRNFRGWALKDLELFLKAIDTQNLRLHILENPKPNRPILWISARIIQFIHWVHELFIFVTVQVRGYLAVASRRYSGRVCGYNTVALLDSGDESPLK